MPSHRNLSRVHKSASTTVASYHVVRLTYLLAIILLCCCCAVLKAFSQPGQPRTAIVQCVLSRAAVVSISPVGYRVLRAFYVLPSFHDVSGDIKARGHCTIRLTVLSRRYEESEGSEASFDDEEDSEAEQAPRK